MLDLQRPVVYVSIECTGLNTEKDRIVELAMIKVHPAGQATAVHGLTKDMLKKCPSFATLSKAVYGFMEGCDLAGYNVRRLVVPMITMEFQRCDMQFPAPGTKVIDLMRIFHKHEGRNLAGAVQFFLNRPHKEEHGALEDAVAAVEVLAEMVVRYDLPRDVSALEAYACGDDATLDGKFKWDRSGDGRDIVVFDFGKYNGKTLKSVAASDPGYIAWMIPRFAPDVVELLNKAQAGRLHEVKRPPRRQHQPTNKPTAQSALRLLSVANDLASRAADQLTELLQQQQINASAQDLPSDLVEQVAQLHAVAEKMQHAVGTNTAAAQRTAAAVTAMDIEGRGCSSADGGVSTTVVEQAQVQLQALSSQLAGSSLQLTPMTPQVGQRLLPPGTQLAANSNDMQKYFRYTNIPGRGRMAVFTFGMHAGKPLLDKAMLEPSYLEWMCRPEVDFPLEVRQVVAEAQADARSGQVPSSSLRQLIPRVGTLKDDTSGV